MVQVIEQQGNILGRIGAGIGKGLSEQVPKEIDRARLSSGLRQLGQNPQNQNPIQQIADLSALPGGSELAPSIMPFLQQQQQNEALKQRAGAKQQAIPTAGIQGDNVQVTQEKVEPSQKFTPAGFATPSEISRYKSNVLREPSSEDVNFLASEMLSQGLTRDRGDAMALARNELSQNRQAQQLNDQAFKTDFDNRYKLDIQGSGLGDFSDLAGEIQNQLLDQGLYLVNEQGESPAQAAEKISSIAKELAKTSNKTKETGSFMNMFRSSDKKTSDLRQQKKMFEKYGWGEQFNDFAAAQLGITRLQAAHVLDPVKNSAIQKDIENINSGWRTGLHTTNQKQLEKLVRDITPKDNVLSIAYQMRKKGKDVNQFLQKVRQLEESGEIALTDRQKREIQNPEDNSVLGDILYETF